VTEALLAGGEVVEEAWLPRPIVGALELDEGARVVVVTEEEACRFVVELGRAEEAVGETGARVPSSSCPVPVAPVS